MRTTSRTGGADGFPLGVAILGFVGTAVEL
jgi:hypothetical protein